MEAEAAALMMRSSHGQLVVDSLRSLRAASSGIAAVAEGAAGAGSGSRISYKERRNSKHMKVNNSFCSSVYASAVIWFRSAQSSHCKEISIYLFAEKELRGLSPNFHIHVSLSDLYIPTLGPPIFLQQNRQTDCANI